MPDRTIEDRLREEYFDLLPDIRRVAWQLETEIRYATLPIQRTLTHSEQLIVKSRVKECESALKTLSRAREGRTFDPERPGDYSLLSLPDLAGVRVLVFPRKRLTEVDRVLHERFPSWTAKPLKNDEGAVLAPKYFGHCEDVGTKVLGEYQIVPMLLGLFWEVEHSAIYKPDPRLSGRANSREMKRLRKDVETTLARFEDGFESIVRDRI
jgi:hypothetical protein